MHDAEVHIQRSKMCSWLLCDGPWRKRLKLPPVGIKTRLMRDPGVKRDPEILHEVLQRVLSRRHLCHCALISCRSVILKQRNLRPMSSFVLEATDQTLHTQKTNIARQGRKVPRSTDGTRFVSHDNRRHSKIQHSPSCGSGSKNKSASDMGCLERDSCSGSLDREARD